MDHIQETLKTILPTLTPTLLGEISHHLVTEVGVNSHEDLQYLEYDDFPMLKPIQKRRILETLKRGRITCIKFSEYDILQVLIL